MWRGRTSSTTSSGKPAVTTSHSPVCFVGSCNTMTCHYMTLQRLCFNFPHVTRHMQLRLPTQHTTLSDLEAIAQLHPVCPKPTEMVLLVYCFSIAHMSLPRRFKAHERKVEAWARPAAAIRWSGPRSTPFRAQDGGSPLGVQRCAHPSQRYALAVFLEQESTLAAAVDCSDLKVNRCS